jgi:hypothetical protein
MSAAFERYAAAEMDGADDEPRPGDVAVDLEVTERNFIDLSDRLHDAGVNGVAFRAWERAREAPPRPRYH